MTVLAGGALLVAGVVLYLLEPLFSRRRPPVPDEDLDFHDEAAARRRVALTALRDLEYDRATGKVDGEDYELLRSELSREALRRLDADHAQDGDSGTHPEEAASRELEDEIAAIRRALRAGLGCEQCGRLNDHGAHFCGGCGGRLGTLGDQP